MSKYSQRFREAKAIIATLEGEKAHSSITDWVEILTSERYTEDSLDGVTELMESIRLQGYEGVTESSRAIRKKLKYGNVHRQIRALTVSLDGLVRRAASNAVEFFRFFWHCRKMGPKATSILSQTSSWFSVCGIWQRM